MAGTMQWFQVSCPTCAAQLQVRLPEGITSVQCSQCKAVFAVQIQPTALAHQAAPAGAKRSRKRKAAEPKDPQEAPRALSAYNIFMKKEVAAVKAAQPDIAHRDAFKQAAEQWQHSPMNPQNGGDRFPVEGEGGEDGGDGDGGGGGGATMEAPTGAPPAPAAPAAAGPRRRPRCPRRRWRRPRPCPRRRRRRRRPPAAPPPAVAAADAAPKPEPPAAEAPAPVAAAP